MAVPSTIGQVRDVFPKLGESPTRWCSATSGSARASPSATAAWSWSRRWSRRTAPDQLRGHLMRALDNGVTKEEIIELITHLAFYVGWPRAGSAALVAKQVFTERKI